MLFGTELREACEIISEMNETLQKNKPSGSVGVTDYKDTRDRVRLALSFFTPASEGHGLCPWMNAPTFGRDVAPLRA